MHAGIIVGVVNRESIKFIIGIGISSFRVIGVEISERDERTTRRDDGARRTNADQSRGCKLKYTEVKEKESAFIRVEWRRLGPR